MNNPNWWYYRELIQIVVGWRIESRPFDFKPSVVNHFAMPSIERSKEVCFFCPLPLQGRACACKILWLNFQEFKSSATLLGNNSKKIVIFSNFLSPPSPYPPPPPPCHLNKCHSSVFVSPTHSVCPLSWVELQRLDHDARGWGGEQIESRWISSLWTLNCKFLASLISDSSIRCSDLGRHAHLFWESVLTSLREKKELFYMKEKRIQLELELVWTLLKKYKQTNKKFNLLWQTTFVSFS